MKKLGVFKIDSAKEIKSFKISHLKEGINDIGNFFVKLAPHNQIEYVIDKVCNHAGGRLILKKSRAVCPMHGWQLNLESLKYNDSHVCKDKINFEVDSEGNLLLSDVKSSLVNPFKKSKNGILNIRWLNHAAVYLECNGKSIVTDPWLFGPAFLTGWWLATPSHKDSIELLKKADYVYISHNHPDHLHAETLSLLHKDKKIIVADFTTKSCEKYLKSLGFTNIDALPFNEIFEITEDFQVSILKSGDFRDDSGIYISANGYEVLLSVDCNFLNSYVLPKKIDLLMTSFAGGASGFPLCYENFSSDEKDNVLKRNRGAIKLSVSKYIQATEPTYYMPYAGMFKEKSYRDSYIYNTNIKNSLEEYQILAKTFGIEMIVPLSNQELVFNNDVLVKNEIVNDNLIEEDTLFYIDKLKEEYSYNTDTIINYLKNSRYKGNQIVQFIPTDDNFEEIVRPIVFADFNKNIFKTINPFELIEVEENCRVMQLKIRPEIFMCVIENKLPWEDFSIGFQMRVKRYPDEYESDFWYYFTNIYVGEKDFRYSSFCGSCTVINQNPIWIK
jgi:CMP-N-acetylneuraminate monooxygenase